MTAIKQISVTTAAHARNLARYLDDERALARDSQHIVDDRNWEAEMASTRAAYAHDAPSRAGAANCVMMHRVIAFLPEDASMNGGKMGPEECMAYARQYVEAYLPSQECVWVLHRERCAADGTERFAVHVGINRTDLETGKRFDMGRSKQAKVERANQIRDMDRAWGLRQMVAGERNSLVHARQPTRQERAMAGRGARSDKQYIREAVRASVAEANRKPEGERLRALGRSLEEKGVRMAPSKNGKDLVFERVKTGRKVNGVKLGRGYSMAGIAKGLGIKAAWSLARAIERDIEQDMER